VDIRKLVAAETEDHPNMIAEGHQTWSTSWNKGTLWRRRRQLAPFPTTNLKTPKVIETTILTTSPECENLSPALMRCNGMVAPEKSHPASLWFQ
jgi:hypothetical protein